MHFNVYLIIWSSWFIFPSFFTWFFNVNENCDFFLYFGRPDVLVNTGGVDTHIVTYISECSTAFSMYIRDLTLLLQLKLTVLCCSPHTPNTLYQVQVNHIWLYTVHGYGKSQNVQIYSFMTFGGIISHQLRSLFLSYAFFHNAKVYKSSDVFWCTSLNIDLHLLCDLITRLPCHLL